MQRGPNWDLRLPAPGAAFKILLLSGGVDTAGGPWQAVSARRSRWESLRGKLPHWVSGE